MMHGMMWGWGVWMVLWGLVGLTVLIAGVLAIVWLVRNLTSKGPRAGDPAEQELRRRYAAGEINRDQYLEMSSDLSSLKR